MIQYLLDTDICIYLIKQSSDKLLKKITRHDFGSIGVSSITVAELEFGVQKSQKKHQNKVALAKFLTPFQCLHFDTKAAMEYGILREDLERRGTVIGSMDMLIAAIVLSRDVTLVSNNFKEFKRVSSLKVENWAN